MIDAVQVQDGDGTEAKVKPRYYYFVAFYGCKKNNNNQHVVRTRKVCYSKRRILDEVARFTERLDVTFDISRAMFEKYGSVAMRADKIADGSVKVDWDGDNVSSNMHIVRYER